MTPPLIGRALSDNAHLTSVCLSCTSGLNREQRGVGRPKLEQRQPMSHVTWTSISSSKGQGHQATLLTAVLARQATAAVGMGTCWLWESATTLPSARPSEALWHPRGRKGAGHIVVPAFYSLLIMHDTSTDTLTTKPIFTRRHRLSLDGSTSSAAVEGGRMHYWCTGIRYNDGRIRKRYLVHYPATIQTRTRYFALTQEHVQ